jgi:hypothetical protein
MLRNVGTILLAFGFLMLASAWAITDPTAGDANVGAGGLILLGLPAGALAMLLVIADVFRGLWLRRTPAR